MSAATMVASDLSVSSVQSAINSASAGDTVVVPSGTATWNSTLTVNKPITLQGAGIDATIIISGGPQVMTLSASSKTQVTRITGFTINGGQKARGIDVTLGNLSEWGLYRIDHCKLKWCTSYEAVQIHSLAAGVVDHCRFEDNYLHFEVQAGGSYSGGWWMDRSWQLPISVGTANCQVFENNAFVRTAGGWTPYASSIQNGQGCRLVFRYNTWTNFSSTADQPIFDLHGNQGAPTANNTILAGGVRANRNTEIYGNTFVAADAGGVKLHYRGGVLMCYSNTYIGSGFDTGWKMQEEDGPSRFSLLTTYPGYDQQWAWIWGNYQNGVLQNTWYNAEGESSAFLRNGQNIHWVPPSGSATGDPDYFMAYYNWQGGRVSPAITSYTPLVYPHPLVSGSSGGGSSTNPIVSISPGSLDFGLVPIGSTKELTFTVKNVGGGTLSGTVSVPPPFSILGASAYSLASNASQVVTIRYAPTVGGNSSQTATFTGGGGGSATVSGMAPPAAPEALRILSTSN